MSLYRIAQESVNNIVKQSGASEVKAALKHERRQVRLTVEDNGRGFQAEPAERARRLGGKESIQSSL